MGPRSPEVECPVRLRSALDALAAELEVARNELTDVGSVLYGDDDIDPGDIHRSVMSLLDERDALAARVEALTAERNDYRDIALKAVEVARRQAIEECIAAISARTPAGLGKAFEENLFKGHPFSEHEDSKGYRWEFPENQQSEPAAPFATGGKVSDDAPALLHRDYVIPKAEADKLKAGMAKAQEPEVPPPTLCHHPVGSASCVLLPGHSGGHSRHSEEDHTNGCSERCSRAVTLQDLVDLMDSDGGLTDEEVAAELEANGVDVQHARERLERFLASTKPATLSPSERAAAEAMADALGDFPYADASGRVVAWWRRHEKVWDQWEDVKDRASREPAAPAHGGPLQAQIDVLTNAVKDLYSYVPNTGGLGRELRAAMAKARGAERAERKP
jgi:hypothetical protein